MSALGQKVLVSLLTEKDAVELVAREGLDPECVPTEDLRKVVEFSLDYFHRTGRTKAPTPAVLSEEFGDLLLDHEIDFDNVEESIEWALDDLRATYIHKQISSFNKNLARSMSEAETHDRIDVASGYARDFVSLISRLESHETVVDGRVGMADRVMAYEEREANRDVFAGITFGLGPVDDYTRGIHPGELACVAGGPKTGKSYFLIFIALQQWRIGRTVVLYTLENSVEMTLDRVACLATEIDADAWQEGTCSEEEVAKVRAFQAEMEASPNPIWIHQPPLGRRNVETMVLDAKMRGADCMLIDQLTFVEPPDETQPRHLQIRETLHLLKALISTGRDRLACVFAHQINREGVKAAEKIDRLEMYHMAEGSEVERTVDWAFGLYRSMMERLQGQMKFQTLACRRKDIKNFQMGWAINRGHISVLHEITFD